MEALRLATRLGVMNAGEILQTDSPGEVMNHPVSEFVASLVGVENLLLGNVIKKNDSSIIVSVSGLEIEAMGSMEPGEKVVLCIRTENVILSDVVHGGPAGTENTFPANVVRTTPMVPYQKIHLNCGFPLVAYVSNPSVSELSLKKGSEVLASFKAKRVHAIVGASRSVLTGAKSGGSSQQDTVG